LNIHQNLNGMAMHAKDAEASGRIENRRLLQLLHMKLSGFNKTMSTGQHSNECDQIVVSEVVRDLQCREPRTQHDCRQLCAARLQ